MQLSKLLKELENYKFVHDFVSVCVSFLNIRRMLFVVER